MARVLVSGANGFIASHIVELLLAAGHEVVGTVRDCNDQNKVAHLKALPGDRLLTLVEADLTADDPFGALTADVDYVMHTASPYVMHVADPQRDLVDPAVKGTCSMLEACLKSKRIKRVIVTSSMAAITDEPDEDHVLTESDWNERSSLERNPYYYSKTQAERAAWDFVKQNEPRWDLVTINPFMVLGPSHTPSLNTTNRIFVDLLAGKYPMIFALTWGLVDVRDVALAHLRAMERPEASGRYLCAGETRSMRQVVGHLKRLGYRGKLPKLGLDSAWGTRVAQVLSHTQPKGVGSYLRSHLGRIPRYDASKAKRELGLEFRSPEQSIEETMTDLERWGHLPKPPRRWVTWAVRGAVLLGGVMAALLLTVWLLFGRGAPYPDLSTAPEFPQGTLEVAVSTDIPLGNSAVSKDGRIFFTVHPEANQTGPKLYEWKDGQPVPYPDRASQAQLFQSPLGLTIDQQDRLWVIDPADHGMGKPALLAFDLNTNTLSFRHDFSKESAPVASFLQDLQVDPAGKWVYIADVGFWAKRPAIVVVDVEANESFRRLERHDSVYPQNYLIRNPIKDMSFFWGLLEMKTGVDGIALSRDGERLYYGAMNHETLFRVPTAALRNRRLSEVQLEKEVETVGTKPLNDGFSIDDQDNVFITDVEHRGVARMNPDGTLVTVIDDDRVRWADGLSFGPDGWLYLTDSAIPHLALQSPEHIAAHAPYKIWRFKPGTAGAPGQ